MQFNVLRQSGNFSNSSLHHIFESEHFRFPFSTKNSQTYGVKYEKIHLGHLLNKLRKLYLNGTVI